MKPTISLSFKNTIDLLFFSEHKLSGFPQSVMCKILLRQRDLNKLWCFVNFVKPIYVGIWSAFAECRPESPGLNLVENKS